MKRINTLLNELNKELAKIHPEFEWDRNSSMCCGNNTLYGEHISIYFLTCDLPIKSTGLKVASIFRKYYHARITYFRHTRACLGWYSPNREAIEFVLLFPSKDKTTTKEALGITRKTKKRNTA